MGPGGVTPGRRTRSDDTKAVGAFPYFLRHRLSARLPCDATVPSRSSGTAVAGRRIGFHSRSFVGPCGRQVVCIPPARGSGSAGFGRVGVANPRLCLEAPDSGDPARGRAWLCGRVCSGARRHRPLCGGNESGPRNQRGGFCGGGSTRCGDCLTSRGCGAAGTLLSARSGQSG